MQQDVERSVDPDSGRRPRAPLLIGGVFVLLGGMFIGALTTTVMLRTSLGSAGDMKARHALTLHALLEAPDGIADAATITQRTSDAFAHSFVVASAALDTTASLDDRQRMVDVARWMVATDALGSRDDAVSRWSMIAARCVDAHAEAPRTAANCVRDHMPLDVPVPDHARD